MPPIIPISRQFDQSTLGKLLDADAVVQRYRRLFALFDWTALEQAFTPAGPGRPGHPPSAYVKALLVRIGEHLSSTPRWRAYLLDHPLLVLELGFRPHLDLHEPYGFRLSKTVPSVGHLNAMLRTLDSRKLSDLFAQTVQALQAEIPGLGEVVAYDVKHIYAWGREHNPRESMRDRSCKERQPTGDPDGRVGVKRSTNQEQPDGSTKEVKEYLWGYGSGVAAAATPDYGDVVIAENTLPFNEADVTYYRPLYLRTVVTLDQFPIPVTAAAAFDDWYVYETVAHREGIAAIPLNTHGHEEVLRDPDGTPRCSAGLRMHPTYQFAHTNGFRAQRFRCPLLFPTRTGQTCEHPQFAKAKGCVKDPNWEKGGLMRALLDRDSPLYQAVYTQRTCCERINSQAKNLGIERPKARNIRSIRRLNTLIYLTINAKALQRARAPSMRPCSLPSEAWSPSGRLACCTLRHTVYSSASPLAAGGGLFLLPSCPSRWLNSWARRGPSHLCMLLASFHMTRQTRARQGFTASSTNTVPRDPILLLHYLPPSLKCPAARAWIS
jgi:hypothetical protein